MLMPASSTSHFCADEIRSPNCFAAPSIVGKAAAGSVCAGLIAAPGELVVPLAASTVATSSFGEFEVVAGTERAGYVLASAVSVALALEA